MVRRKVVSRDAEWQLRTHFRGPLRRAVQLGAAKVKSPAVPARSLMEARTYRNRMAKHLHMASAPMISVKTRLRAQLCGYPAALGDGSG
jgi:hypothetical protein